MATIYCFSSTGNSLYVSKKLAERIEANVISMTKLVDSCEDNIIGFVFPTYFWGLPKAVEKFISHLDIKNGNAYIFAITTYGGIIRGVIGAVQNLLSQKGLSLSYGNKIKSVENYIIGYKINDSEEFQKSIEKRLEIIVNEISDKQQNKIDKYNLLNRIIYSFFPAKTGDCDKFFSISQNCTECGNCKNICPAENILLKDNKPIFLHNCEHCLACIHICSANAIEWKKSTVGKKRYRNPYVTLKELIMLNNANKIDSES